MVTAGETTCLVVGLAWVVAPCPSKVTVNVGLFIQTAYTVISEVTVVLSLNTVPVPSALVFHPPK